MSLRGYKINTWPSLLNIFQFSSSGMNELVCELFYLKYTIESTYEYISVSQSLSFLCVSVSLLFQCSLRREIRSHQRRWKFICFSLSGEVDLTPRTWHESRVCVLCASSPSPVQVHAHFMTMPKYKSIKLAVISVAVWAHKKFEHQIDTSLHHFVSTPTNSTWPHFFPRSPRSIRLDCLCTICHWTTCCVSL